MIKTLNKQPLLGILFTIALVAFGLNSSASAQRRLPDLGGIGDLARIGDLGRVGEAVNVQIKLGEVTLESIDFRNQTATLNLGLDVANGIVPVNLKDFDYRLRLANHDVIDGFHSGTLKIGGRRASRIDLPVTVRLRSIPNVVWSAFTNRGQLKYELDSAFTLPLFVTEKRFDQSFSGEVPLRSLVDASSILRARRMGGGSSIDGVLNRLPW
jgi:hypothetical protein